MCKDRARYRSTYVSHLIIASFLTGLQMTAVSSPTSLFLQISLFLKYGEEATIIGSAAALADDDE